MKHSTYQPTEYERVLPRDAFNEAKLLKCIGQLTLLIEDSAIMTELKYEYEGGGFKITLLEDGHLMVQNIIFYINDQPLLFKSTYNSKANYPLLLEYDCCEYPVFDDNGTLTENFIEILNQIKRDTSKTPSRRPRKPKPSTKLSPQLLSSQAA